jgi:hypothetical protein
MSFRIDCFAGYRCGYTAIADEVILAVGKASRVVFGIAGAAFLLLFPVMRVAPTAAVANAYLDRPITVGDAYRSIRVILMPIAGTYLLY